MVSDTSIKELIKSAVAGMGEQSNKLMKGNHSLGKMRLIYY